MGSKSFAALYAELEPTPAYQASGLAVNFLADVHARMKMRGMSQADLARKVGVSPGYLTKLFRGSTDLSVETMAKFSDAFDCKLHLRLFSANQKTHWFDEVAKHAPPVHTDIASGTRIMQEIDSVKHVTVHYKPVIETDFFDVPEPIAA